MALFGQDRPDPAIQQLGGTLGDLITGGPRRRAEEGYLPRLQQNWDSFHALNRARISRAQANAREGLNPALVQRALGGDQAALGELGALTMGMATGQPNLSTFTGGAKDIAGMTMDRQIGEALALGDLPTAQRLSAVKTDRVLPELGANGGLVFTPVDGSTSLTPLGESELRTDDALVRQRQAGAASNYATADATRRRVGIAEQQFALERAGQWNPSGSKPAAGNRVFTFFEGGRQTSAPSPDGQHYFRPDGTLAPMPPSAVEITGSTAVAELQRDNIRSELDSVLGELGSTTPAPGVDPYARAVSTISGPLDAGLGRAATYVAGLAGDDYRRPQREAESYVDNVNQMVKSTLVNNPRFPQFEQRIVDRLLPGAGMSEGQQMARANELRRVLQNQIEQKRMDIGAADPVEARRINQDIRQITQILRYMNQGPASTRSGVQPSGAGVRVPVSRSARPQPLGEPQTPSGAAIDDLLSKYGVR